MSFELYYLPRVDAGVFCESERAAEDHILALGTWIRDHDEVYGEDPGSMLIRLPDEEDE